MVIILCLLKWNHFGSHTTCQPQFPTVLQMQSFLQGHRSGKSKRPVLMHKYIHRETIMQPLASQAWSVPGLAATRIWLMIQEEFRNVPRFCSTQKCRWVQALGPFFSEPIQPFNLIHIYRKHSKNYVCSVVQSRSLWKANWCGSCPSEHWVGQACRTLRAVSGTSDLNNRIIKWQETNIFINDDNLWMIRWKNSITSISCGFFVKSERSSQVGAFKSILKQLGSATYRRRLSRLLTAESLSKEVDVPMNSNGPYI